jgi:hypothetical protein
MSQFFLQARVEASSANQSVGRGQDENPGAGSMSPYLDKKERLFRNPMEPGDARASEEEDKISSTSQQDSLGIQGL